LRNVPFDLLVGLGFGQLRQLERLGDALLEVTPGARALLELRETAHRILGRDVVGPEVGILGAGFDLSGVGF
jgi:hypothetical protein